jgi:hypothetical protein
LCVQYTVSGWMSVSAEGFVTLKARKKVKQNRQGFRQVK